MKRMVRAGLALGMSVCLAVTAMAVPADVSAKKKAPAPKKITLNKKSVKIQVGKKFTVKVKKIKPKKASKKATAFKFKSSKKKIATVSKKGVIKGKKVGSCKVTVTSKTKKKVKATIKVKVVKKTPPTVTNPPVVPATTPPAGPGTPTTTPPGGPGVPTTDAPATNPPAQETNVPATNVPATNVPATNVPATNVPATNVPATNVPATNVPATNVPATNVPATNVPATNVPATNVPATNVPATNVPTTDKPATAAPATIRPILSDEKVVKNDLTDEDVVCKSFKLETSMNYVVTASRADGTKETVDLPLTKLPEILGKITDPAGVYEKLSKGTGYIDSANGINLVVSTPNESQMTTKKVTVSGSKNDRLNGTFYVSVDKEGEAVYKVTVTKEGSTETVALTVVDNADNVSVSGVYNGKDYRAVVSKDKTKVQVYDKDKKLLGQIVKTTEGYDLDIESTKAESREVEVGEDTTVPPTPPTGAPATGAPATGEPATEAPATGKPATEAPATAKPIVIPEGERLTLTNKTATAVGGQFYDAGGKWLGKGIENADGSLTYYTNALYSGSGADFKFNEDGSKLDLDKYSKVIVSYSGSSDGGGMCIELLSDKGNIPKYPGFNVTSFEFDLSTCDRDITGIRVKYNGYEQPYKGATDEEQIACKANFTIHAIVLVEKDTPVVTEAPETAGPATQAPETAGPATQGPETAGPATQGPATAGPATQGPATEAPSTAAPTPVVPTEEPITDPVVTLDLSKSTSYTADGNEVTAEWDAANKCLKASVPFAQGIIFKIPDDATVARDAKVYQYAKITYTATKSVNLYVFDKVMGNDGKGQEPGGQVIVNGGLPAASVDNSVICSASDLKGIKIVRLDFDDQTSSNVSIKSVQFSTEPFETTPATEAPATTAPATAAPATTAPATAAPATTAPATAAPATEVPWKPVDMSTADNGKFVPGTDSGTGTLEVKDVESIAFTLSEELPATGKLEVKLEGMDTGGSLFRVWAGGYQNNRTSSVATHTDGMFGTFDSTGNGGEFSITCNLTLGATGVDVNGKTKLLSVKGYASWSSDKITQTGKMDDMVFTSISYRLVDEFSNK